MSSSYDVRLRQFTPGGAALPILPTLSIDFSAPRSDIPTLSFTASEAITGGLPDLLEVAAEVWNGEAWIEPKNGRFFLLKRSGDDLDPGKVKTVTCVSLLSFLLSKAEIVAGAEASIPAKGTVGKFLASMIAAAKARGWGSYFDIDFTDTADSTGVAWTAAATLDMTFTSGTTLASALQTLADQGAVEYETQGRTLHLYNPFTGDDLSAGTGKVQVGSKSKELPVQTTNEDLATHVTIRGDEGKTWTFPIVGATDALGRLEVGLSASGVTEQAQAENLAELYQATAAQPRHQYTITEAAVEMAAYPFVGYKPGDWVSARRPNGWERMRVTQVQVRKGADAVIDIDTIVADRLTDLATRIAKRNAALGARLAGNGRFPGGATAATTTPVGDSGGGIIGTVVEVFQGRGTATVLHSDGKSAEYRRLASYTPIPTDEVALGIFAGESIILGKIRARTPENRSLAVNDHNQGVLTNDRDDGLLRFEKPRIDDGGGVVSSDGSHTTPGPDMTYDQLTSPGGYGDLLISNPAFYDFDVQIMVRSVGEYKYTPTEKLSIWCMDAATMVPVHIVEEEPLVGGTELDPARRALRMQFRLDLRDLAPGAVKRLQVGFTPNRSVDPSVPAGTEPASGPDRYLFETSDSVTWLAVNKVI